MPRRRQVQSTIIELYLGRLKSERQQSSDASLTNPTDKSEYGYGKSVGYNCGLKRAEQLLEEVLNGEDDDEDK